MRSRWSVSLLVCLALPFVTSRARAQDILVPAGTLLRCTMNEPNFSSATAQVGDPVLCHLGSVQQFGHNAFPRGAYMTGHLEASKDPGHFWGKGYLRVVFDRIGTPSADINVSTKIIGTRSYSVNKEGDIKGKGHPRRDVVEWMIPPLWPWKLLMLPARGPRPTLKGEQILTLRLMEDVTIPRPTSAFNSRDWRPPHAQLREQPSAYEPRRSAPFTNAPTMTNTGFVTSIDPAVNQLAEAQPALPPTVEQAPAARQEPIVLPAAAPAFKATDPRTSSSSLTLIALRNESIWAVTEYWLAGDRLDYILPSGAHESCALNDVDLMRTTQLNAERGISVTFHAAPASQTAF
jgi:hypothetical protein